MSERESNTENKTCPACFNKIDRRATKCPYCQSYQGVRRVAAFVAAIGGVLLLLTLILGAFFMEFGALRQLFHDDTNYADQVTIQSSKMFLGPTPAYEPEDGKVISVVGRLTNDSPRVLSFIRMRIEVKDGEDQLVDSFEGTISGPLNPSDSTTFRVDSHNRVHLPESDYRTHIINVRQATAGS
ncbi:MAG: hypothetical protein H8E44_34375 [Planctomycetes bacterium]|nr:hypothetical protein [Planctomycetota bacterium]MBL7042555.1 hypothetical protein [Pirellulaceae bacterium]